MGDLPLLIRDLALIMGLAGVVTVLFRRLGQPLVLGYIVAGFLASPFMPWTPSVSEGGSSSIEVWSELGVIFLMFSLGLEFSFKRIVRSGFSLIFTTLLLTACMLSLGMGVARLLGMDATGSLWLGAMLCVSSTTIVYKAFNDMGLSQRQFAGKVMGVLVLEDIVAIVLMAFLSSLGAGTQGGLGAGAVALILARLLFFLLLWFLVGIWLIPTMLRRWRPYMTRETLLIVSVALCFVMVLTAHAFGYGAELGAFVMGSILAETLESERIESEIASVRDLFGAVFFVSVGMMVEPLAVMAHWGTVLLIVGVVVVGDIVFGSLAFLFFGSSLSDALKSGFSLVQIGEFSFIIASMGVASGVIEQWLYPVIVAVSVLTTFITPYSIKLASRLKVGQGKRIDIATMRLNHWHVSWLPSLMIPLIYVIVYGVLSISVVKLLFVSLLLFCRSLLGHWAGNALCGVLTLSVLSLFLRPMVMGGKSLMHGQPVSKAQRSLALVLSLLRFALAVYVVYYIFDFLSPFWWQLHIVLAFALTALMMKSRHVKRLSHAMEAAFLYNVTRKGVASDAEGGDTGPGYARQLRGSDLHVTTIRLPLSSLWAGKSLADLGLGATQGVIVTAVIRGGERRVNIPGGGTTLFPGDELELVGDDLSISRLARRVEAEVSHAGEARGGVMRIARAVVGEGSLFLGLRIRESAIRERYACLVIGREDEEGTLSPVGADYAIGKGDVLWLVGEYVDVGRLRAAMHGQAT